MLWILAFHVIFMVAWFAGLFYLPRLFVYHAAANDSIGIERFKVMEHKLFYFIMTPAAVLTTLFGLWLLYYLSYDLHFLWMQIKLAGVILLWVYHLYCGRLLSQFKQDHNQHSSVFFRWFNEIPTLLLMLIVIMVVVKP